MSATLPPAWRETFLDLFTKTGNVMLSAKGAGVGRRTVYEHRERDPEFAAAWKEAEQNAVEVLEAEARRRAMSTSDVLLIFLLKAHAPEKYRDRLDLRLDLTREVERIAKADGLDPAEVLAEAQRIVAESRE